MAWMPRLELLRSDEVEQCPLVELIQKVRPDLAFPWDVDEKRDRLAADIWRSVGEARELRPLVRRPPCRHPVSPKLLRKLALGRNRRHLDRAVPDGVRNPRPRQNRREKQRHCQHPLVHSILHLMIECHPVRPVLGVRIERILNTSNELMLRVQDRTEIDARQVGCGQVQTLQHRLHEVAFIFIGLIIKISCFLNYLKVFY